MNNLYKAEQHYFCISRFFVESFFNLKLFVINFKFKLTDIKIQIGQPIESSV